MSALIVLSTFPEVEEARTIARTLVEEQLAACATVIPGAESVYWWKGVIESSAEAMVFIKTTGAQYEQLQDRLKELHPNELPEIVALEIKNGLPAYLEWIIANTGS